VAALSKFRPVTGSVWRSRDFWLVLGGGFINNVGDWLLVVALPAFIYVETGSGGLTATIVVIELAVGIVFGPTGGALADRWDLRRTVVITNVLQAVGLLPLLAVTSERVWPAFVVAGVQGLLQQVNDPASFALVPRIVDSDQLIAANSANTAASAIARLVGAPLGGIAAAFGGLAVVVVVDAATFLVVAVATSFVRTPTPSLATDGTSDEHGAGVGAGWRQIRRYRSLVGYLAVQALAAVAFAMFPVLFIAFVVDVLDGDEATVGIIRGMAAFGGITASVLVGRYARQFDPTTLMAAGYAGLGVVAFVFVNITAVTTTLWLFLVLFALSGLPNITSQVGAMTAAQRLCPPAVLGRLQGLASATTSVGAIVGSVGVGLLIDRWDVKALLNVQAALYLSAGVLTYLVIVRQLTPPDLAPAAADSGRA
jgi:predicted MFS family arabinose efflux permease